MAALCRRLSVALVTFSCLVSAFAGASCDTDSTESCNADDVTLLNMVTNFARTVADKKTATKELNVEQTAEVSDTRVASHWLKDGLVYLGVPMGHTSYSDANVIGLLIGVTVLVIALGAAAPTKREDGVPEDENRIKWEVPFYIFAWMILSAGLTVFNKWMFMPEGGNFPFVASLSWVHMLTATILTQVLRLMKPGLFPAVTKAEMTYTQLTKLIVPIGILQSLVLVLGNSAYLYLSVSYIQMIKAAMPGMVFIISYFVGLERFTWKGAGLLLVLGVGVTGCSHGELLFSWLGLGYQLSSFFCEAGRLILMKLMLSGQGISGLDPLSLLFYLAPMNLMSLTAPMMHEYQTITAGAIYNLRFILAANCITAFGLNVASVCLMSAASVVTFTICGLLKDLALILGSTLVFHNVLTSEQLVSTVVVLTAAIAFQQHRASNSK